MSRFGNHLSSNYSYKLSSLLSNIFDSLELSYDYDYMEIYVHLLDGNVESLNIEFKTGAEISIFETHHEDLNEEDDDELPFK